MFPATAVTVLMKNKVIQFPQPGPGQAGTLGDRLVILSFGEQRFAVQFHCSVTEVNRTPAEVLPIQTRRQRKGAKAKRKPE